VAVWHPGDIDPHVVADASLSFDGSGVWVLVDTREDGRSMELVRVAAPGEASPAGATPTRAGVREVYFLGFAPDDSFAAIGYGQDAGQAGLVLQPTDGRAGTYSAGGLAGFVSAAVVDTWPAGSFAPAAGAAPPARGTPLSLLSADEIIDASIVGDRDDVLATFEHDPEPEAATGRSTVEAGEVRIENGIAFHVACLGPSPITLSTDLPDDMPLVIDCAFGSTAGQGAGDAMSDDPVTIRVEADARTAWRIVVYDPPPPGR
jgi:hypothetical protein